MPTPDPAFAYLAAPDWHESAVSAPRHCFIPDRAWTTAHGLIDRAADAETWWSVVYSDTAILTQIDDGATEITDTSPWTAHTWSCSCSAPNMVFDFLRLLDPYPGDRVLEIGSGTGWTAALLSAQLGAHNVTTVEVDEQVAKQASAHLDHAGVPACVVAADGAAGYSDHAPYDRLHVTCGVATIPYAWVQQTRPGGVIVAPWIPNGTGAGHKVTLTVRGDDAIGRFHGDAAYMLLRAQRPEPRPIDGQARESTARIDPRRLTRSGPGLAVALAGMLPDVSLNAANHPDGSHRLALRHLPSDSHALAIRSPEGGTHVTQRGPRDLWDEAESAYLSWVGWGTPDRERFGLTITPHGQHVWLDHPDNSVIEA